MNLSSFKWQEIPYVIDLCLQANYCVRHDPCSGEGAGGSIAGYDANGFSMGSKHWYGDIQRWACTADNNGSAIRVEWSNACPVHGA